MSDSHTQVGVIGAGRWGRNIVRTLAEMGALGGVADASPEIRRDVMASHPDARIFDDHRALLASDVPAVAIATPVHTHYAVARAALEAGKDVFVEKPMTTTTAEAESLVRVAAERDAVLMVGHLLLYQPAIGHVRACLRSGRIGRLISLHQERLNLGTARSVENALWSLGVHDVAVLLDLVGTRPESVEVSGHAALQTGIEDDVYLHLAFARGVRAHLHSSWLWPERRRRLTLVADRAMLVYDELAGSVTLHHKRIDASLRSVDEGVETLFEGDAPPLALEMEHFIECIRTRRTPVSDGRSAIEVVRTLEAATAALTLPRAA